MNARQVDDFAFCLYSLMLEFIGFDDRFRLIFCRAKLLDGIDGERGKQMRRIVEQLYFSENDGLIRISDSPGEGLPLNECQIILDAYSISQQLDFVYFRRFTDRASQPVAFIVDNTKNKNSFYQIPVCYV